MELQKLHLRWIVHVIFIVFDRLKHRLFTSALTVTFMSHEKPHVLT